MLAPWVVEFIDECAAFPAGANDDQHNPRSKATKTFYPPIYSLILGPSLRGQSRSFTFQEGGLAARGGRYLQGGPGTEVNAEGNEESEDEMEHKFHFVTCCSGTSWRR